jgi:hypothetical protein
LIIAAEEKALPDLVLRIVPMGLLNARRSARAYFNLAEWSSYHLLQSVRAMAGGRWLRSDIELDYRSF